MSTINATGASTRLLELKDVIPHECLVASRRAILQSKPVLRHAGSAKDEWEDTPGKHLRAVGPEGTPVYFSGPVGFYDVCISDGHGNVVAIDTNGTGYHAGEVHVQSITSREKQVGGKLLGWSSEFLGYQLSYPVPAAPKPKAAGAVTTADIKRIAAYLHKHGYGNSAAAKNGVRGPVYWRGVQKFGRAHGMYGKGYIINGIPGNQSRAVERYLDANAH